MFKLTQPKPQVTEIEKSIKQRQQLVTYLLDKAIMPPPKLERCTAEPKTQVKPKM